MYSARCKNNRGVYLMPRLVGARRPFADRVNGSGVALEEFWSLMEKHRVSLKTWRKFTESILTNWSKEDDKEINKVKMQYMLNLQAGVFYQQHVSELRSNEEAPSFTYICMLKNTGTQRPLWCHKGDPTMPRPRCVPHPLRPPGKPPH